MRVLLNYFLRGLAVVGPLALTAYVCWRLFVGIDSLLGIPYPGVGFVVTIAFIIAVGFLASTFLARGAFAVLESVMSRLPFVRLLYTSTKDFFDAFVGEKKRFDRPVLVTVYPDVEGKAMGFVTQDSLTQLGLSGQVAVYFPFSYSVASRVLVFPAERVQPLAADSADVMAFLVSGGVTRLSTGRTPAGARAPVSAAGEGRAL